MTVTAPIDRTSAGNGRAKPLFVVPLAADVDRLAEMALDATCSPSPADVRARAVVILPRADATGQRDADKLASRLHRHAASVRVAALPAGSVARGGTVADWLGADGLASDLQAVAEDAPLWTPPTDGPAIGPVLTCIGDVAARAVDWLWPGRIPAGRITLLVGRPGEGKSFLTLDAAARVSTATPWPDGEPCPRGSVLLLTGEDDPADTIRPRLDAMHADVRRVHLLSAIRRLDHDGRPRDAIITLADIEAVETALQRLPDCRLVIVDPIGSFLGGGTDAHRDNEVRAVLAPVARLAELYGPAVLVVAHRRKSAGTVADDLAIGSRAFTGIARAVWHVTRDPNRKARRLMLPGKNNLAAEGHGLAFSIAGEPPTVCWAPDPVEMHADDALAAENAANRPGPDADDRHAAEAFLRSALAEGPRPAKDVLAEAREAHAISKRTLDRARKTVGVNAYRPENPGPWHWRLPGAEQVAT